MFTMQDGNFQQFVQTVKHPGTILVLNNPSPLGEDVRQCGWIYRNVPARILLVIVVNYAVPCATCVRGYRYWCFLHQSPICSPIEPTVYGGHKSPLAVDSITDGGDEKRWWVGER